MTHDGTTISELIKTVERVDPRKTAGTDWSNFLQPAVVDVDAKAADEAAEKYWEDQ